MATAGGCELDLEGFEKQLQSLFKSFKNSSSSTIDAVQVDRGKTFCSDFSKLVEEYTCHWQTPLPRLRILEVALCYFVRGSHLFRVGCDDVRSMLSSLALSVFELLLFFDEKDFNKDPLKHFTITFQECHMCLVRHQNVHLIQVSTCIQDGGPWAHATLQSILEETTIPQIEVDTFIGSQLPLLLELRVRYLLTCERISEAMALAKCCSQHPTAGQHHFFLQVYLTCLHKTSQHDRLNKEVAELNGKDAVQIICNMESEESDESIVLTLARAFLSQQLRRGYMDHLGHLVFIWSKLQLRLQTSKQVLLEEIQQLMLTATNVNSVFPFIKVLLEELGKDGHQFCVELCTKALQSCLPSDVPTKSLIYKTLAGLFPNDLEMCQICALLVFFLERTVEAFKMVFSLYIHPDQDDHAQASPVSNQVRFETLQVLKMGMHFDPEFWNPISLRANCLNLLSDTVASDAVEEIMAMWVPDYCMKEPDFHLNTNSSNVQQRTKVAGVKKRRHTKDVKNHVTAKRFKASSDLSVKSVKNGNTGKRSVKKASTEYLRQCFWRIGKTQEDSQAYHRFIIRLSEKNPTKRNISKLQWIIEDPERLEQSTLSDYRKLRPNIFFFLGDMPYLYTSVSAVASNGAAAKSQHPQTSGAQDSHKEPLNMEPALVLTPLPRQMVRHSLCPPESPQQCSSGEDEDDGVYDSDTSISKMKRDVQEGRKLNKDATSKTQAPQINTNVFFFLGDMPYLYTSVSPVAPNRPADKSHHPQTSGVKNSNKDPLNMEPAVVHTKLDSPKDPLNMEPAVVHTKLDSPKDPLNMEPAVVHTKLDSPKDPLNMELAVVQLDSHKDPLNMEPAVVHTKVHSQKDPLKMEPVVILTKLDSHKHPLNMERPVDLTKLDSHKPPLNMEPAVVHTKLYSPTDPLNMEPALVHTKLYSPTDPLNMEPAVVHTKLDSPTDPLNMESAVVHTKLYSPTDPLNMESAVVHTKLYSPSDPLNMKPAVVHTKLYSPTDPLNMEPAVVHTKLYSPTDPLNMEPAVGHTKLYSPTDPLNMEPAVVHTKLYSPTDPLNMEPAVILTPLPLDMVRHALGPPAPQQQQQQFSSVEEEESEDSVYDTDMCWESADESSSEDSDWLDLEYVAETRRRILKQGRIFNKDHATSVAQILHADRNGMRAYLLGAFTCPECTDVAYTSSLYLWKHMRRCHNQVYRRMVRDGEIPESLPVNGVDPTGLKQEDTDEPISLKQEDTDEPIDIYSHRLSTRPVPKRTYRKKDPFICDFCFKLFDRFYQWKDHQRVHTGEKNFNCEQCDKKFGSIGNLRRHLAVHSGEKPFQCKECGKSFTQISSLNRHLRVHTGEKPFQCLQCPCTFTERSSLKVHQRNIHFREKFQCDQCDRSFGQPSNLRRHKSTHSGVKPFQCGQCDKSFYHLNECRRHQSVHSAARLQCEQCEKSFIHMDSLKRHTVVHGAKPFQCLLCDCSYTTVSSINRHQRDVHDDPFLSTPLSE